MNSIELFFDEPDNRLDKIEITRKRKLLRDLSNPLELDERNFRNLFRLSKSAFKDLLDDLNPMLKEIKRSSAVPNILKLAAALRFFSEGPYQKGVGNDFNLGLAQPTFSLIFKEILNLLETHICPKWIQFLYSDEEKRAAKMYFYDRCRIPGVIGCVDGTHIKIISPGEQTQHLYYNRKGFHSINAMLVCDHQMKFRYVNAKHPGASHDSMIWNLSNAKNILRTMQENGDNTSWLLGDSGYMLDTILLTPFREAAGRKQTNFNQKHSIGRNIIERAIGVLKSRFRCLLGARQLHYSPEKVTKIANICVALHNICISYKIELGDELLIDREDRIVEFADEDSESDLHRQAVNLRNKIADSL